jgi:hypothetical protein
MEALAYLHLELAASEPVDEEETVGASWDSEAWNEIFDSAGSDEELEEVEE